MRARLLLLTGPAAGEVIHPLLHGAEGFHVRDFQHALRHLLGFPNRLPLKNLSVMQQRVCVLESGEAWLVGLVLPAAHEYQHPHKDGSTNWDVWHNHRQTGCWFSLHEHNDIPARLAILAPSPPPLLVERVRAWEGEIWVCFSSGEDCGDDCRITDETGETPLAVASTWSEAVRAALGEAK